MLALALIVAALLIMRARARLGAPSVKSRFGQGRRTMRAKARQDLLNPVSMRTR